MSQLQQTQMVEKFYFMEICSHYLVMGQLIIPVTTITPPKVVTSILEGTQVCTIATQGNSPYSPSFFICMKTKTRRL